MPWIEAWHAAGRRLHHFGLDPTSYQQEEVCDSANSLFRSCDKCFTICFLNVVSLSRIIAEVLFHVEEHDEQAVDGGRMRIGYSRTCSIPASDFVFKMK